LGPSVFEKTQTQKFALRAGAKKGKPKRLSGSDFGLQLLEKQKARVTYGLNERQFKNLVEKIIAKRLANTGEALIQALEMRLDNAVYRLGLASTRQAARQLVSHGHIDVDGKRVTVPSYALSIGDTISIREGSLKKGVFQNLAEKLKEARVPSWLSYAAAKHQAKVEGKPKIAPNEVSFDLSQIIQYYSK
jgi:small subunit ribosomal protein S4